jgi:hypothetical protein
VIRVSPRCFSASSIVGSRNCRVPRTSAIWSTPLVHTTNREGPLRVDSGPAVTEGTRTTSFRGGPEAPQGSNVPNGPPAA